ncbi:hypothetical protein FACS1894196_0130 [Clostridia bacterium]|nr:hypothetical protein FACS1894196_0130 [Clostridia bacterium]
MSIPKETALAARENTSLAGFEQLADIDMAAMMAEELDGLDAGFERIRIPSGGGLLFEVPGEDGEPEPVREFSAVILYHHPIFAYYASKYTGANNPPDCGSLDGVTGEGNPGGSCKLCPHNRFGTGENGSKACKNRRRIYVLREGEIFPLLLSLPTGSLKEFTRYLKRLLSKGNKSNSVVTRFTLKKATNSGGIAYSQAQFAVDRPLMAAEHALVETLTEQMKAYSDHVAFDYEPDGEVVETSYMVDPETGEIIQPLGGGC